MRKNPCRLQLEHLEDRLCPSGSPIGLIPSQVADFYQANQIYFNTPTGKVVKGDGTGQTIAIVIAYHDGSLYNDLTAFDTKFQLPNPPTLIVENQNGGVITFNNKNYGASTPDVDRTGATQLELSMDVEWSHAIAPGANILVVEANSMLPSDLSAGIVTAARQPNVSVVSVSIGSMEDSSTFSGIYNPDFTFTTPNGHQGVTFVAASGDSGSHGDPNFPGTAVDYPASSPNVVAVGGTVINTDSNGNLSTESAWNGSGGGISQFESEPSYQESKQTTGKRTVPDVAFDAGTHVAVYDSNPIPPGFGTGPWVDQGGGTSLGAPCWAGIFAIADQGRVLAGLGTLDGPTQTLPDLYAMAAPLAPHRPLPPFYPFHAILGGSNGAYSADRGFGYNYVTGLGSPNVYNVVYHLTPNETSAPPPTPITFSTATLPPGVVGQFYNYNITVTGGSGNLVVTETGAPPAGVYTNILNDKMGIAGTPQVAGSFPIQVTATDSAGDVVTQTYTLVIAPSSAGGGGGGGNGGSVGSGQPVLAMIPGYGVYMRGDDSSPAMSWQHLTSAWAQAIAVNEENGNGIGAVISFPSYGTYLYTSSGGWLRISAAVASCIAVDGQFVVGEFPGYGVHLYNINTGAWTLLSSVDASQLAVNAAGVVVGDFYSYGVHEYNPALGGWYQLSPAIASQIAIDSNGDVLGEFSGYGVHLYKPGLGWITLSPFDATSIAMNDSGNIAASFYPWGTYLLGSGGWTKISSAVANHVNVDQNGGIVGEFNGYGISFYDTNNAHAWFQLTGADASLIATRRSA